MKGNFIKVKVDENLDIEYKDTDAIKLYPIVLIFYIQI